ncbi:Transposase [Escherichia coli]|nr:Transposase [Escherichia coli]
MTCSDDTHENEANMMEEIKNELRYFLRRKNAYLKAMQEHFRKKRQELEKNESHPEPEVRTLPV